MKDENHSVAIVKAPPSKENPVAISKGTRKKVADMEERLFTFQIDYYYYYTRKTTVPTGLTINTEATSHIIRDAKKFKNHNQTF